MRAPEVGSRIAGFTNLFGIGFLDTMTVTEYVPDRSWTTIHTGDFVRGEGIFAVEPDGEGCVAIWVEDVDVPFGAVGTARVLPREAGSGRRPAILVAPLGPGRPARHTAGSNGRTQ